MQAWEEKVKEREDGREEGLKAVSYTHLTLNTGPIPCDKYQDFSFR